MAVIGYMRVSTHQQKFDSQQKALERYGVDLIYKERESGRKTSRSELNKVLACLKSGDTLVIFKLDRLSRGTKQLLSLLEEFEQRNIHFVSIQNNIDTTTAMGRFFFTVMGAFAEMEAELIRERVMAGLDAARESGQQLGRPPRTKEVNEALKLYANSDLTVPEIAKRCNLSVPTVYNHIRKQKLLKRNN
ncbi:resolvase [Enterococcus plantarum]|uniref:Resolvase n=1 Tax=Enterococcus plantarum TaxID=1077675 RepID=A0A2W3ZKG3_9ENTE|nr:recombinase family protein [Enterococcus plantarum]MBO0422351.1 recombinase family protein [Enterococcus plantarum]OEG17669.1 resolvase [Enterococcus plantarum]PZL77840.1 resolvase [Enterococcus plantarum]